MQEEKKNFVIVYANLGPVAKAAYYWIEEG
jgi:hypothetical protein